MVTALDSNIIIALFKGDGVGSQQAEDALMQAASEGDLILSPVVFAELLATPMIEADFLDDFLKATRIKVVWSIQEKTWRQAAQVYQAFAERRRKQKGHKGPRRILADFIIGAHAVDSGARLLIAGIIWS